MQGGSTNNFGRKLYWMKLRTFDSKMNNEEVQERGQVQTRELLTVYDDGSVSNSRTRGISFEVDCVYIILNNM